MLSWYLCHNAKETRETDVGPFLSLVLLDDHTPAPARPEYVRKDVSNQLVTS